MSNSYVIVNEEKSVVEVQEQGYAVDIGNSRVKMMAVGEKHIIKQPSVVTRLYEEPRVTDDDLSTKIKNLKDELVVQITSKAVSAGIYAIGTKALRDSGSDNMDISLGSKHTNDIPVICTLGMIAADQVTKSYDKEKDVPPVIRFKGYLSTSIPASEWSPEKAAYLEKRFREGPHVVIVYVNDKKITVMISFMGVKVTAEGLSAFYALQEADDDILVNLDPTSGITTPSMFKDKKKLGVDVGDGTTEYPYLSKMKPVLELCHGERRGVGHAKEKAMELLNKALNGHLEINRQRFTEILDNATDKYHTKARNFMDMTKVEQAKKIRDDVEKRYRKLGGDLDLCMVYGGGSVDLKDQLYKPLEDFCKQVNVELLWVPEKYAEDLNVLGLEILHRTLFFRKGE